MLAEYIQVTEPASLLKGGLVYKVFMAGCGTHQEKVKNNANDSANLSRSPTKAGWNNQQYEYKRR